MYDSSPDAILIKEPRPVRGAHQARQGRSAGRSGPDGHGQSIDKFCVEVKGPKDPNYAWAIFQKITLAKILYICYT